MRFLFTIFFFLVGLYANPFDDFHRFMGKRLSDANQTDEAMKHYLKIDDKSDALKYNMGNLLYKQHKYKEAIELYKNIKEPSLQFAKFYNLGDSYAKSKMFDEAIDAYQKAIKLKNDSDAKTNLAIVKKLKQKQEEEQKAQEKNQNSKNHEPIKGDSKANGNTQEDFDGSEKYDNKRANEQQKAKNDEKQKQGNNERASSSYKDDKKNELPTTKCELKSDSTKQAQPLKQSLPSSQTSDEDEKKWLNIINKKEFNTLMIPLTKNGAKNDKTINPW